MNLAFLERAVERAPGIALGLVAAHVVVVWSSVWPRAAGNLEAASYDLRAAQAMALRGEPPTEERVLIVDVDERSLEKLGRWPWPREYHARLLDALAEGKPAAVAFDVIFADADRDPSIDSTMAAAAQACGVVVWSLQFTEGGKAAREQFLESRPDDVGSYALDVDAPCDEWAVAEGPTQALRVSSSTAGFVNVPRDLDGTVRRVPLFVKHDGRVYPSLAVASVARARGLTAQDFSFERGRAAIGGRAVPVAGSSMILAFPGPYRTVRYVSYYDVMERRLPPEFYADKIVIVGSSAPGLGDLFPVPFSPVYPGVEVQAAAVVDLLDGRAVNPPSALVGYALTVVLAVAIGLVAMRARPYLAVVVGVAGVTAWAAVSFWAFVAALRWIEVVRPVGALTLSLVGSVGYRVWREERDKRRIVGILSLYVAPSVVKSFVREGLPTLSGERRRCTVLFTDLAGFTEQAERVPPEVTAEYMNGFLTAMTDVVFRHGGTVDKFIGDAVMAIFNAPVELSRHEDAAVRCAIAMQGAFEKHRSLQPSGGIAPGGLRVGIATGDMLIGNFGSKTRFAYTAIGDPVNLGSRLEGLNKAYGSHVMIDHTTRAAVSDGFVLRELDTVRVVGRHEPVTVFEVLGEGAGDGRSSSLTALYARALAHYRAGRWDEAARSFERCASEFDDEPSRAMLERVVMLRARSEPWDGVWNMETK